MIVVASTFSNNSLSELHMKYFSRTSFRLQHSSRICLKNSAERHFEWRYQRELYGFTLAWLTCYKGCRCQPLWTDHAARSVVVGLSEWVISQLIVFWLPACWQAWYYWHIGGLGCAELTELTNNCGSGSVYLYTYWLQFWPILLCSRTEARETVQQLGRIGYIL